MLQELLVFELDDDGLPRADVGDARGEDTCGSLMDGVLYDALTDAQPQPVDRSVLRNRERIDALVPVGARVVKNLHDARPRSRPAYAELDVGRDQCGLDRRYAARIGSALPGAQEKSSLLDLRDRRPVRWRGKQ